MAMPQCCYLAKGAKRPSHTTNTINSTAFHLIPAIRSKGSTSVLSTRKIRPFYSHPIFRCNNRTNQIIYVGSHVSLFSSFFLHSSWKWNSLPLYLRNTSISLHTFKSRLRKHLSLESCRMPIHTSHIWRDFRFT